MRTIDQSNAYKRDLKRESKGKNRNILMPFGELQVVTLTLADDKPLPLSYRDHALHNNWEGFRECHLRHDFLLVYAYIGDDILWLERLGTHSEIFGL